jgi:hypothetical protein
MTVGNQIGDFKFVPQGWECPKCGRVYSPSMVMCSFCGQNNVHITWVPNTNPITTSGSTGSVKVDNVNGCGSGRCDCPA